MIPPPVPTPEFHIRVDESYGLNPQDSFLLNFLLISGENDYRFLKELVTHINDEILQLADILAGEYRRYFVNKSGSNFAQFLEKNKNLI